jgi:hypothetical protein
MTEIGELVVRFERDMNARSYPYLGQVCLLGHVIALLRDYPCKQPVEFSPLYATPEAMQAIDRAIAELGGSEDLIDRLENLPIPEVWCMPDEGWKTARCLQAALLGGGAAQAEVQDIVGELSREVDDFVMAMEAAVEQNIRFHVNMQECPTPPAALVTWVERDFTETAEQVRDILGENGIL